MPLALGGALMLTLIVQLARPAPAPTYRYPDMVWRPAAIQAPARAPDYSGILSRPLFTPARGAAGGSGVDQAASTTLSDYTLVGVASVGGRGEAILRGPAGEVVNLRVGEALLGWDLASIGRGGIVLRQGDVQRAVAVSSSAAPKTGAP